MPINAKAESNPLQPLYFKSLQELDAWTPGTASKRYAGILKYTARRPTAESLNRGNLLVCHDYKGGYTESLFARSYTFNFWSTCKTFVYFSHHRVTIPPPGWINAAHRQGVKMLGTLIFEGGGEEDCLRLIVGKMPGSKTGQIGQSSVFTLPLSPHYATLLAELAQERGFDGYLLNFECPLSGGLEQTRALSAWITLLQSEVLDKVGPHGETLWYDSVVINGQLAWQDRLNSYNLPFFLSSTGLFSNYTWRNNYPALTAQYFLSLDPALIGNTSDSHSQHTQKTLQDIYMGVDVWGRGSHGGGGFGCYKALSHVSPESLGLSVALFGMAWTWESKEDKPGRTWDTWWEYERKLWVGPREGQTIELPEAPLKKGEPECTHGPFLPISSFFSLQPPPDPADLPFHTTFCPGTGLAWFVDGSKVYQSKDGWTDVDKQTSVGDLIWPLPKLYWEDEREDEILQARASLCMDDAWNGGNSVQFSISCPASTDDLAAYRPVWLPIHSLSLTPKKIYEATAIYKVGEVSFEGIDTEFALVIKSIPGSTEDVVCNIISTTTTDISQGWTKLTIRFNTTSTDGISTPPTTIALGLVIAILAEDTTNPFELSFLLGQLNVSAYLPDTFTEEDVIILWADFTAATQTEKKSNYFSGTLSWEAVTCFPAITKLSITSPEDPISAWNRQPTIKWFPSFLYFDIYAQLFADEWNVGPVENATWIGTSGWDGQKNGFDLDASNLPFSIPSNRKVRFYIRGVNDRGEVMRWEKCAYVDVSR